MAEKLHIKLLTVKKALTSWKCYKAFGKAHLCIITSKTICTLFHKETGFRCPRTSLLTPLQCGLALGREGVRKRQHTGMCAESLRLESTRAVTRVMPLIWSVNSSLQSTDGGHKSHPSAQQPSQLHLQPQKNKVGKATRAKTRFHWVDTAQWQRVVALFSVHI